MPIKLIILALSFSINVFAESPLEPLKLGTPRETMKSFITLMNKYKTGVSTHDTIGKDKINDAVRTLNLDH